MEIALTGGIGAGKSTVARLLAERGAVVIDADALARAALAPGSPGEQAVLGEFGPAVAGDAGEIDRGRLASLVFTDPAARSRLEAIVHPIVREQAATLAAAAAPGSVIVHEIPLLAETWAERPDRASFDLIVTVEAPAEVRLARLRARGMADADARARMAAQADDAQRRAIADVVIDNSGADCAEAVARLWQQVTRGEGPTD